MAAPCLAAQDGATALFLACLPAALEHIWEHLPAQPDIYLNSVPFSMEDSLPPPFPLPDGTLGACCLHPTFPQETCCLGRQTCLPYKHSMRHFTTIYGDDDHPSSTYHHHHDGKGEAFRGCSAGGGGGAVMTDAYH